MRGTGFGLCQVVVVAWILSWVDARVRAEGSAELDAADTDAFLAHDQAVDASTVAFVDILDGDLEKICYRGNDGALQVFRPGCDVPEME